MERKDYLNILVNEIHSAAVATIGADGHPQLRTIDMMLWDERGVYFLTAKGKDFYKQLTEQKYIALSAAKNKLSVSIRGKVKNIYSEKLEEIFEENVYMKEIYPEGTRNALEVFCLYEAYGEYFDISNPSHIVRDSFVIGNAEAEHHGYFINDNCCGCKKCIDKCPQSCIQLFGNKAKIDSNRCLHCGICADICQFNAVERR